MSEVQQRYQEARKAHQEAEDAYEAAVKEQFGPKANIFSYPESAYNGKTKAAAIEKRRASILQSEAADLLIASRGAA